MGFSSEPVVYKTPSKAISCGKSFCISSSEDAATLYKLTFIPPKYQLLTRYVESLHAYVHFSLPKPEMLAFQQEGFEIHHVVEYISSITSRNNGYIGSRLYIYIIQNSALIVSQRISDYLFAQVFQFQTALDLLYYIQKCYSDIPLNPGTDQVILCGHIELDSAITRLISIYFNHWTIDPNIAFDVF